MFTEFDVIVAVIILISTMVSFVRGATKDFLSLVGWGGSAIITLVFYPYAASFTEELFRNAWVASISAVVVVYMISLGIILLMNSMILDNLRDFRQGTVDRILGFLFGLVKGFVFVSIIHFCIVIVAEKEPDWLAEGETHELTSYGNSIIENIMGDYIKEKKGLIENNEEIFINDEDIILFEGE